MIIPCSQKWPKAFFLPSRINPEHLSSSGVHQQLHGSMSRHMTQRFILRHVVVCNCDCLLSEVLTAESNPTSLRLSSSEWRVSPEGSTLTLRQSWDLNTTFHRNKISTTFNRMHQRSNTWWWFKFLTQVHTYKLGWVDIMISWRFSTWKCPRGRDTICISGAPSGLWVYHA